MSDISNNILKKYTHQKVNLPLMALQICNAPAIPNIERYKFHSKYEFWSGGNVDKCYSDSSHAEFEKVLKTRLPKSLRKIKFSGQHGGSAFFLLTFLRTMLKSNPPCYVVQKTETKTKT